MFKGTKNWFELFDNLFYLRLKLLDDQSCELNLSPLIPLRTLGPDCPKNVQMLSTSH